MAPILATPSAILPVTSYIFTRGRDQEFSVFGFHFSVRGRRDGAVYLSHRVRRSESCRTLCRSDSHRAHLLLPSPRRKAAVRAGLAAVIDRTADQRRLAQRIRAEKSLWR